MTETKIRFETGSAFARALNERVDAYFRETGQSRRGGGKMLLKTAIIFAWLGASLGCLLVFEPTWSVIIGLGVSAGLATAGLGMSVQHDGGHRAYSTRPAINRAAAFVLDICGASSHVWHVKHGIAHHTYPNIEGADDDIDLQPFARTTSSQPLRGVYRFQHLYIWPMYGFLAVKWFVYDDFRDLLRGRVGQQKIRPPKGRELVIFIAGKLIHFGWAIAFPVAALGLAKGLVFYAVVAGTCGIVTSMIFQLAHCVEETEFFPTAPEKTLDFFAHQLATTVDFGRGNGLLTWYVGGLNFQAIHHLFPRICHLHYPALAGIVESTAREYGVPYHAAPSLRAAVVSHYRWLQRMGTPSADAA